MKLAQLADLILLTSALVTMALLLLYFTVSTLFRADSFFACLRLCQDQATCAQPEALRHANRHAIKKMC